MLALVIIPGSVQKDKLRGHIVEGINYKDLYEMVKKDPNFVPYFDARHGAQELKLGKMSGIDAKESNF